ncbi:hypothetical protein [Hymenobacter siberiensis]|jgi:hypothetical protein|uniref:hypothetical protein n=1 Tax=Hymenobacter siberiensis TaxID=2848396 RepID=UPI001C1E0788|nr:hypothetical protein [Hymenobacter siberiensis]MBU6119737.1 hypothetical protein [Hymenobacter siberiensis]
MLPNSAATTSPSRITAWVGRHPGWLAWLVLTLLFSIYLLSSEPLPIIYDAKEYWQLAEKYRANGDFRFLAFDSVLRGYLFPLLLSGLVWLLQHVALTPLDLTRAMGAVTAGLLFGVVMPGLWRALQPMGSPPVPLGRRLMLGALGFAFWRGYFNFPLSDFPALLALAGGLWMAVRSRSVGSGLLVGLCVAAAANFRPVYAATLPLVLLLSLWPQPGAARPQWLVWFRGLAVVAGMALVMAPQVAVNQEHFGVRSPFVLTDRPGKPSLYLNQLEWGLRYQKYETSIAADYPIPPMVFGSREGYQLWTDSGLNRLTTYAQYGQIAQSAPLTVASIWLVHLFNGLDLQYTTPYVQRVYASTWGLAWLNYTVLFGGFCVLASRVRRRPWRSYVPIALVLAAFLGPCLATLPVAMECRFLLPIHLILYAGFAFGAQPLAFWRRSDLRQHLAGVALYATVVVSCFIVSTNMQLSLDKAPRYVFKWQRPEVGPPKVVTW